MKGFAWSVPYLMMLALAAAACGEAEPEGRVADGMADGGTARFDAPPVTVTRDVRVDGYEHDLVPINWLGVSPADEVALLQWQDHQVRFSTRPARPRGRSARTARVRGSSGGWSAPAGWATRCGSAIPS